MKKYIAYLLIVVISLTSIVELNSDIDISFAASNLAPYNVYYDTYDYTKRYWVTDNFIIGYYSDDPYLDKTQSSSSVYNNDDLYDVIMYAGEYLETARNYYNKEGYLMPYKWNNEKYSVDFWSWGIGGNVLGFVAPDEQDTRFSYMQLNSALLTTRNKNLIKNTTAHEFFHAVQGRYLSGSMNIDFLYNPWYSWWSEATAVWSENQVWPDINSRYTDYVSSYLQNPNLTLFNYKGWDNAFGTNPYKNVIFAKYLNDRYGRFVIKESWERIIDFPGQPILAIKAVLESHSYNLENSFLDFATWNYFAGGRYGHNDNGYQNGRSFSRAKILNSHSLIEPVINQVVLKQNGPQMFGVNYVVFDIPSDASGDLLIQIEGGDEGDLDIYTFSLVRSTEWISSQERHKLDSRNDGTVIVENISNKTKVVMVVAQFVGQQVSESAWQGIGYTYSANISNDSKDSLDELTSISGFEQFPTPFKYQWVAQSGVTENGVYTIYAQPGDTVSMSLTLRNRSTDPKALMMYGIGDLLPEAPPYQGGHELRLGTDKPRDNVPSWMDVSSFMLNPAGDSNRFTVYDGPPANVGEEIVLTWDIKIADDATPDTHDLYIALLREFDAWAQEVNKGGTPISSGIFWRFVIE